MLRSGTKILVVCDRRDLRAWIADTLLEHAYDVRTAQCGLEALDQMAVFSPDVLITDVHMPRMSGLELMVRIRNAQLELGIVAMSEMESARDAAAATQLGADRFLLKPFGRAELFAAIEGALPRSRAPSQAPEPSRRTLRTVTHRWRPAPGRVPAGWRPLGVTGRRS